MSNLSSNHQDLSSGICDIKAQIEDTQLIQHRIFAALKEPISVRESDLENSRKLSWVPGNYGEQTVQSFEPVAATIREVYYMVFLYLGHFLKNLLLALTLLVRPSRALMPTLLAKYNISFLDALGRQPRILPYEYFRSLRVLQAFVHEDFKNLPGSLWVKRGRYELFNTLTSRALSSDETITPGVTILMSMVTSNRNDPSSQEVRCPALSCGGKWAKSDTSKWMICPACRKEVLITTNESGYKDGQFAPTAAFKIDGRTSKRHQSAQDIVNGYAQTQYGRNPSSQVKHSVADLDEAELPLFKRVVQWSDSDHWASEHPESAVPNRRGRTDSDNTPPGVMGALSSERKIIATQESLEQIPKGLGDSLLEADPEDHGYDLPCDFFFVGCEIKFRPREIDNWIDHSLSHFHNLPPPSKSICIFCDFATFESQENPHDAWRKRMLHISEHYRSFLTNTDSRPDFWVLDYLQESGLISQEDFTHLNQYTERPVVESLELQKWFTRVQDLWRIRRRYSARSTTERSHAERQSSIVEAWDGDVNDEKSDHPNLDAQLSSATSFALPSRSSSPSSRTITDEVHGPVYGDYGIGF